MQWTINTDNTRLTLTKGAVENAFTELFHDVLKADELVVQIIESAQNTPMPGVTSVTGTANTWGSPETIVVFQYTEASQRPIAIELRKPIAGFRVFTHLLEGLPDGHPLKGINPFGSLRLGLLTEAPEVGQQATEAIMSLNLVGLLDLGHGCNIPFRIEHPHAILSTITDAGGNAVEKKYPFTVEFPFDKQHPAPGFSQLAALLGNSHNPNGDLEECLPENVRVKPFELENLRFRFDLNDPYKLINVEIKLLIAGGEMWEIVPDMVAVGGLWIDMEIAHPLQTEYRLPVMHIGGTLRLGDDPQNGNIAIKARWPDYSITGELMEGQTIRVGEMLRHYHLFGTGDSGFDDISISRLYFSAEPVGELKQFSFLVVVDQLWHLKRNPADATPIFSIDRILLSLDYSNAPSAGGMSARIEGQFTVAGVDINLRAEHSGGQGWLLAGKAATKGDGIPVGELIADLAGRFLASGTELPIALTSTHVSHLGVTYNTLSKDFTFTCETKLLVEKGDAPEQDKILDVVLDVRFTKQGDAYTRHFSGKILIAGLEFDLVFDSKGNTTAFLAAYKNKGGGKIKLNKLIEAISTPQPDLPDIEIDLKDVAFLYYKDSPDPAAAGQAKYLFHLDIGADINLSQLPLAGKYLGPDLSLNLLFSLLAGSKDNNALTQLKAFLPDEQSRLPATADNLPDLQLGIQIGDLTYQTGLPKMTLQAGASSQPAAQPAAPVPTPAPGAAASSGIQWLSLQKTIGPIAVQQLGIQFADGKIAFLLQASMSVGPLSISLDGLGVRTALSPIEPTFFLNGMGLEFKSGPLEIGGAFLRNPSPPPNTAFEYDGAALIRFKSFSLAALGSYAQMTNGQPSLFLYAVLNYPIGGPAFFFVTGLAAGFGYNRSLRVPAIEQVSTFPLVEAVMNGTAVGASNATALSGELAKLSPWLPPSEGDYFLAVGIKFNSFKIIDSFAMLSMSFGNRFELNILGLSNLVIPTPDAGSSTTPLAQVQMALKASFLPAEGFLGVQAQLTSISYVLSPNCHLTGGFAFFCWFSGEHEGDFVLSLGGYHKKFNPPAHYPQVPRLGFNWQVTQELSLKGEMYFALTGSAVMAGGRLEALWISSGGHLQAWFVVGADFLLAWKPYHYDAQVYVDMGVSYTFRKNGTYKIKFELGADLHIWGPEFSGTAEIHLWIVDFTIDFGAGSRQAPKPLENWSKFRESFLPAADKDICNITLLDGLVKGGATAAANGVIDLGVVNPKNLSLIAGSLIPSTTAANAIPAGSFNADIGVAPMDKTNLASRLECIILHNGTNVVDHFVFTPVKKAAPTALWGKQMTPNLNGKQLIGDTLAGYEVRTKAPVRPTAAPSFDRQSFLYETEQAGKAFAWADFPTFSSTTGAGMADIKNTIVADTVQAQRKSLLSDLGITEETDLDDALSDLFMEMPALGNF